MIKTGHDEQPAQQDRRTSGKAGTERDAESLLMPAEYGGAPLAGLKRPGSKDPRQFQGQRGQKFYYSVCDSLQRAEASMKRSGKHILEQEE